MENLYENTHTEIEREREREAREILMMASISFLFSGAHKKVCAKFGIEVFELKENFSSCPPTDTPPPTPPAQCNIETLT